MSGLRTTSIVVGALVALLGAMLIISGHDNLTSSARDSDGYIMFDPTTFDRASAAIVIEDIDILEGRFAVHADDSGIPRRAIADLEVRMQGGAPEPIALFMGIAPSTAVDDYLDGVAHDAVTELDLDVARVRTLEYTRHEGTRTPGAPDAADFWVHSVVGTGVQTLDWTVESGAWTAVIMNADGSSGVTTELVFGARASNIGDIAWAKITIGIGALALGGLAMFLGLRRPNRDATSGVIDSRVEEPAEPLLEGAAPKR